MAISEKILRKVRQYLFGLKIVEYSAVRPFFVDKSGLEIGGPSAIFGADNILPIYPDAQLVDGVNFSTQTVWENKIDAGLTYEYGGSEKGRQFILEASNLDSIPSKSYDFLLSSHSLEHCANVLKTIEEWKRVLTDTGLMVIVLPDKRYTFDHRRDVTSFRHLLADYEAGVDETDLTHLEEVLEKHDLSRDLGVADKQNFMNRSAKNIENRCLHHHVFDADLISAIFDHLKMDILFTSTQPPYHLITVVQKRTNF